LLILLKNILVFTFLMILLSLGAPLWAQSESPAQTTSEPASAEAAASTEAAATEYSPPDPEGFVELCGSAGPEEIKRALEAGLEVNHVSQVGLTPFLSAAAFNNQVESLETLLAAGANLEAVENRFGLNALMLAASHNPKPEIVEFLVASGISVDYQNFQGGTALIQAASSNPNPAVTEALIKAGAKVNAVDSMGATALMHAAGYGKTPVIRELLKNGAEVNLKDESGDTALAWAARTNVDSGAIFELLKAKADPYAKNLRGLSILYHSSVNPNSDVLAALLQATNYDLSLLEAPESSPLFAATYFNPNVNVARRLLSLGGKVNQAHMDGMTLLMASLVNPEPAMTKLILSQRVDPNERDSHGRTALMLGAAVVDNPVVIRLLLGAGADLDIKDNDGLSAFEYAEKNKHQAVTELFEAIKAKRQTAEPEEAPAAGQEAGPAAPEAEPDQPVAN
jgi:ankyrin repeat protein